MNKQNSKAPLARRQTRRQLIATGTAALTGLLVTSNVGDAHMLSPALYWKTQVIEASGINFTDALSAAQQVMQGAGLANIKKSDVDVSGRTPNSHAAITFLKIGSNYTAIIMVAGSDAKVVLGKLSNGLDKLTFL